MSRETLLYREAGWIDLRHQRLVNALREIAGQPYRGPGLSAAHLIAERALQEDVERMEWEQRRREETTA